MTPFYVWSSNVPRLQRAISTKYMEIYLYLGASIKQQFNINTIWKNNALK